MAGRPGMKGGGGARPGAGRPKKEAVKLDTSKLLEKALLHSDPKDFLLAVMNDPESDAKLRVEAAKTLMPFIHQKLGEGGKKEEKASAAKKAASKFATTTPPKLVVNNRQ